MAETADTSIEAQIQPQIPPIPTQVEETIDLHQQQQDGISELPDCLLIDILSRLPYTKYAIGTSVLSTRWKSLWTSLPNRQFSQSHPHFVSSVNKTLAQCPLSKVSSFEIDMDSAFKFESQINDWIIDAIDSKVKELTVIIWNRDWVEPRFRIDERIFVNECVYLSLGCCIINQKEAVCWKNLRTLCITYMCLNEDMIEKILLGSPVLETIDMEDCYGYDRIDISSKSVKRFVFAGYSDADGVYDCDGVIEINAPYILSLKIECELWLWKLSLVNVSSLVEAELDYTKFGYMETTRKKAKEEILKGHIESLRHVKKLKIGMSCVKPLSRLEAKGFALPSNLKLPDVTYTLSSDSDSESKEDGDFSDGDSLDGRDLQVPLVDRGSNDGEVD